MKTVTPENILMKRVRLNNTENIEKAQRLITRRKGHESKSDIRELNANKIILKI